jgi:anti-sigma factor RsiW
MNCQEVISLTHAYSDRELDLVRALEFEKHLAGCPACSQAHENIRALKTALQSSDLYFRAPVALSRQIRRAIGGKEHRAQRSPFAWWPVLKLGIPLAGAALLALLFVPALINRSAEEALAQEVTAAHVRSLMVDHKTDVASSDQHTVKPWFQGKLDFTPPVFDLAGQGFPLVGGRLEYLHGRTVAALVYQRHEHFINLFVWPAAGNSTTPEKMTVRQGYNLAQWTSSGMNFWAVSDLNPAELREFANLIR